MSPRFEISDLYEKKKMLAFVQLPDDTSFTTMLSYFFSLFNESYDVVNRSGMGITHTELLFVKKCASKYLQIKTIHNWKAYVNAYKCSTTRYY